MVKSKSKNLIVGYLYFYVHFVVEVLCFYVLSDYASHLSFVWLIPFIYDAFAFVPQSLIGYFSDKYPKINIGLIGLFLLLIGFILYNLNIVSIFISILILCLGNACMHIDGAECTLKCSNGKLSHSAIFVSGGSFGVITGKILSMYNVSYIYLILLAISTIPFILLGNLYLKDNNKECSNFNYHNDKLSPVIIILLAVFIVAARGYIGYGIPTSWNKTLLETIFLYFAMGIGKALGGIFSDLFGIRKVAIFSILLSIPLLIFGDNIMIISLLGVLLFSMTMSITLAVLVSVLKRAPGLAFGLTTIGLFLGTIPIFFFNLSGILNIIVIVVLSLICAYSFSLILRREFDG